MKVWRTVLFILIVIFTYIELENLMPYDTARIFMNILLGLVVFTNGIDCYKNGQRKNAIIFAILGISFFTIMIIFSLF